MKTAAKMENRAKVEVLLMRYLQLDIASESKNWEKAQILAELIKYRQVGWIATKIERTHSYISRMVQTYNVFSDENSRVKEVSFSHHCFIASVARKNKSISPYEWVKIAAEEKLTYRQFVKKVNGCLQPNGGARRADTKQALMELVAELKEENQRLQNENQSLKAALQSIGEAISRVA